MAPLSAGTGQIAVRGFGLKLQQSSSTVASLQPKPSASTRVHLPHLPLNTLLPPGLSRLLCPVFPGRVWGGPELAGWVMKMVQDWWRSWRMISLSLVFIGQSSSLLKIFPSAFTCSHPPVVPASSVWFGVCGLGQWRGSPDSRCVSFMAADPD